MLGIIYRTCTSDCDQKTMLILNKSLVSPQLEYASQVWSPYTKEKLRPLSVFKGVRLSDLTYPERLAKLDILPLEFRREVLDFCFF